MTTVAEAGRITVSLILVNRAITVYEFIEAQMEAGNDLIVRDGKTGETQLVRFL